MTMNEVTVTCSRCGKTVEGAEFPAHHEELGMTSGFYRVIEGNYWHKFARPGETILCDDCMWKDPLYIAEYGEH